MPWSSDQPKSWERKGVIRARNDELQPTGNGTTPAPTVQFSSTESNHL